MTRVWYDDSARNPLNAGVILKPTLFSLLFLLHIARTTAQFDGFGLPMSGANVPTLAPHPVVFDVSGNVPTMEPVAATGAGILPIVEKDEPVGDQEVIPPAPVVGGIESIFGGAPVTSPAPIEEDWKARQQRERAESRAAKKAAMEKHREERRHQAESDDSGDDDDAGDDDGSDESYASGTTTTEPTMEPTMEPSVEQSEENEVEKQQQHSWLSGFNGSPGKISEEDDYTDDKVDDYQKDYHKEDDDGEGGRTDEKDKNRLHETGKNKKHHKGTKLASFSGYGVDFLDSDEFMRNFGVTLSVFGSLASSGGIVLQKIVKQKVEIDNSQGPEIMHFRYFAGLVCVVVGLVCKTIICALLPQLTLAALSAQSFIYTIVFEHMFLDDQAELPFLSIFAAGTVFIGIILSVLSSDIVDVDYSLETLHTIFIAPEALIFTGVLVVVIFLPRFCLSSSRGSNNVSDTATSILDLTYRVVSAAILAMLFGTALKVIAEGLAYGLTYGQDDVNKMKYDAIIWVILFIVLGISKLRFVSTSLQSYHPLLFLPIYQGLSAAFHTSAGVMYFHELEADENRGKVNISMYTIGMSCVVLGLILFAMNYDPNVHGMPNQEEYSEDKESLLNANLDHIYGPPGGKGQRYPNQGHSGEARRGEIRNGRRMMNDDYDHECTNPMMGPRGHEDVRRDDRRNPRYGPVRGMVQKGRDGDDLYNDRGRRDINGRMPPPQNSRRAEPPMMYDNYDDDDVEFGRRPVPRPPPQSHRGPPEDGRQRGLPPPNYRGPGQDMSRGTPSKERRPPPRNTNSGAMYTGGLQY